MGFLLSGFTVSHNVKVQNAITLAGKATAVAYTRMSAIRSTRTPTKAYTAFFGAMDATRLDQAWKVLNMIHYAMGTSFIRYNRSVGRPGTYAAAQRPASGWSEKNVKQMLDSGEFTMKIDDAFYKSGTDARTAALTIVHEISHLVGNTDDVDCPWDSKECYEYDRCRRLAEQYPNLTIKNADSYGYYVMAEYDEVLPKQAEAEPDLNMDLLFA
ncbi:hypothetical protein GO308_13895 [Sphingomonas sp. SFZ2018-12]|uniref:M35 family metallo-endopeptidase n=1 Tax=Sphingomonas sp. SFZ2018-12 TaxID=2683197 RepID=UPI00082A8557|nr:M35 family metallo-endopeptidase [Sphingomonas sp. SFZ2018-12]MCH4894212.1 hypothetical protein [Sphingomonas sp. SFZ2018-12]